MFYSGRDSNYNSLFSVLYCLTHSLSHLQENFVKQRVIMPAKQLVILCEVPERLILKRHDKRLDYDNAQYKLDRNRDPAKTRVVSMDRDCNYAV